MQARTPNNVFLERLAVARLQHTVNELQTQVENDRSLAPPTRKILRCVCDDTALTASISELKRHVSDKTITMIVPFSALDSLDRLKKGTDDVNICARESIRFFDRVQTTAGRKQITGVRIQSPTEKYADWEECVRAAAAAAAARSPLGSLVSQQPDQDPPNRIKELLNCAIYHLNSFKDKSRDQVLLVTNDEIVKEWAEAYNIPTIGSHELEGRIVQEEIDLAERRRRYNAVNNNPRSPSSPGRGGRGSPRGGRGGGGFGRRNSWREEDRGKLVMDPNGFGRGRTTHDDSPPDYILRGPTRGVARGKGKLWEPQPR